MIKNVAKRRRAQASEPVSKRSNRARKPPTQPVQEAPPGLRRILRPSNLNGLSPREDLVPPERLIDIGPRVGTEIRDLRRARDITLTELGERTGLSQGYLSQVERGISTPSIKSLHSISRALGVTVSWFFQVPSISEDDGLGDIVVRRNRRRKLVFNSGITDELLSPNLGRQIELLRCTFAPGSESGDEPYTHVGEEAAIVISGRLHMWIADKHIVLEEGDSVAFSSSEPHRYANMDEQEAVIIWVVTPPSY